MEALIIMASFLFLQVSSQDYISSGYMGCYSDSVFRTLGERLNDSPTNNGDECKRRCARRHFRFAGTENSRECFCGNYIWSGREVSSGCNMPCPNKDTEKCGGGWHISIFDTWPCASTPCLNEATCIDSTAGKFSCVCKQGWEGTICELEITTPEISTTSMYTNSTHHTDDLTTLPSVSSTMFQLINLTSTDSKLVTDDKNSIIIIIVVPSAVTAAVILIILIVCIVKRKTSSHKKHQSVAYEGQGSVPNIYAICAIDAESHKTSNARYSPALSGSSKTHIISSSTLDTCISDENINSLKHRSEDCMDFHDSYDHLMGNKRLFVDKTYSHLNEDDCLRQSEEREEDQYINCIVDYYNSSGRTSSDDTYNRLQTGAVTQVRMLQNEESDYDHSSTLKKNSKFFHHVENEYSHFQNAGDFEHVNTIYANNYVIPY